MRFDFSLLKFKLSEKCFVKLFRFHSLRTVSDKFLFSMSVRAAATDPSSMALCFILFIKSRFGLSCNLFREPGQNILVIEN